MFCKILPFVVNVKLKGTVEERLFSVNREVQMKFCDRFFSLTPIRWLITVDLEWLPEQKVKICNIQP